MQMWEYEVKEVSNGEGALQKALSEAGVKGWEIFKIIEKFKQIISTQGHVAQKCDGYTLIFKKLKD